MVVWSVMSVLNGIIEDVVAPVCLSTGRWKYLGYYWVVYKIYVIKAMKNHGTRYASIAKV